MTKQLPLEEINFSALELPSIEINTEQKRWLNFDIETAIYIMVFFLVLYLSDEEGEKAALSLQLDESLMASLAHLTGDDAFRRWSPMKYTHWIRYHFDVVRDHRWHMMTIDLAYNRLMEIREQQALNTQDRDERKVAA